jgi:outer membrane protein TolC
LPIETANKRNIRIESAQHLAEAAKLKIALSAWQLRTEAIRAVYDYVYNQKLIALLEKEQAKRQEIVAIFQKRMQVGESSNLELSKANLLLQDASANLEAAQRNQPVLTARLANSLGLSPAALASMQITDVINAEKILASAPNHPSEEIQSRAIFNRLDLRIALERYAVAEAKVKLEIARQYPDLVFKPGYAYDFGEKIWSLGLSGLMTILTKNKLAIAEAKQLREVEVAQFEALQANVISEVNTANAKLAQAKQILDNQKTLLAQQQASTKRMVSKLRAGEIDRLEMSYAQLEEVVAEKNYARANYQIVTQINELESAIQAPLNDTQINNDKLENLSSSNQ